MAARGHALLVSVLLRPGVPPVDAGLLPIVAAVGAADALGADAHAIVWPNDILIGGRKVAGILCEMSADQEGVAWAVVGHRRQRALGARPRRRPLEPRRALRPRRPARRGPTCWCRLLGALGDRYAEWVADGPDGDPGRLRRARRPGRAARSRSACPTGRSSGLARGHRRARPPARAHRRRASALSAPARSSGSPTRRPGGPPRLDGCA